MTSPLVKALLIAVICVLGSSQEQYQGCASSDLAGNCISCLPRNYMSNGYCLPVSALCLTYDPTLGNCLTCYSGFMISGKDCIPIPKIANCITYSSPGVCSSCATRFYLSNKACIQVSPFCLTYDSTSGNCLTCNNGYMISGRDCIPIPKIENCKTYSSTGACTSCITGFYLSSNTCIQVSPLCKTYDVINGNCLSCWPGFDLTISTCTPSPISNCISQ